MKRRRFSKMLKDLGRERKKYTYNKQKVSVPPTQVMCRLMGSIQWICPVCSNLNGTQKVKWRQAHAECGKQKCGRKFRIGACFSSTVGGVLPPYNAVFGGEYFYITNRLEFAPDGPAMVGRILGSVDWVCPDCKAPQTTPIEWDMQSTTCLQCSKVWYLRLLMYQSNRWLSTPFDWTPLVTHDMRYNSKNEIHTHSHDALPAPQAGTSNGTPS